MDKILFISCFLDGTGYSKASCELVTAMDLVGIDVCAQNVKLNNKNDYVSEKIQELMRKNICGADTVITNLLPTFYDYSGHFKKNIGVFSSEVTNLPPEWVKSLKVSVDEIWVPNTQMFKMLRQIHRITKPIHIIPFPTNVNKYLQKFEQPGPIAKLKAYKDLRVFYTVGEFVSRKNYEALLKAYFLEFSIYENVLLVIKTSKDGWSTQDSLNKVKELCDYVKRNLKLHKIPEVMIITESLSEQQLEQLHSECDIAIYPSHGEAQCQPCVDSLGFGKTPICSATGGFMDYIVPSNGWLIEGTYEPCEKALDSIECMYKGDQNWFSVNINRMREAMRDAFTNRMGCVTKRRKNALKSVQKFSYETVGGLIRKSLQI